MKKKRHTLRWLLIIVGGLIVLAVIGNKVGWIGGANKKDVYVEKVIKRDVIETVTASGKIQPEVQVKISPDVSGEIVTLDIKEGDHVKEGDLLVRIMPDIYQSYVDRAMASVNTAKANLENSKSRLVQAQSQAQKSNLEFARSKKLYDEKLISSADWEAIKSANEVAKAEMDAAKQNVAASEFNVRSAEASLKEAHDNLLKTTIFAPVDGTISKLNVEKGERVVGTSQMAGTELLVLANLNEMEVSVDVNENDIVRVHVGDTASIEVDAYLDKKFKGIVTEVANSANIQGLSVDQVTNFTVKVRILRESYAEFKDPDHPGSQMFHPGMSATVEINTKRVNDVLAVPVGAVTKRDTSDKEVMNTNEMNNGGRDDQKVIATDEKDKPEAEKHEIECVFVVENGKAKITPVKTGIQDNAYFQIISGLKAGEEVIALPYAMVSRTLKNGDLVNKVEKSKVYNSTKK
jgi:HlyD family secretion protein